MDSREQAQNLHLIMAPTSKLMLMSLSKEVSYVGGDTHNSFKSPCDSINKSRDYLLMFACAEFKVLARTVILSSPLLLLLFSGERAFSTCPVCKNNSPFCFGVWAGIEVCFITRL